MTNDVAPLIASETDAEAPSVAFVTVSYGPDRDRCGLLCRSLDALAPQSFEHLIVVDRGDLPLFRDLEAGRRRVVATEDVLPRRVRRVETRRLGLRSNIFVQLGKPIRGWLVQQLVKLAISRDVSADVIVHADSDVALVRRFQPGSLVDGEGRTRLYCEPDAIDGGLPGHVKWHRTAEALLGLPERSLPLPDFITSLVPWKRANALALLDHLDSRSRRSWMSAVANAWDVSEYVLYGRFVTDVLGGDGRQFATTSSLCKDYWATVPLSEPEIEELLETMAPEEVGLSITAKAGMEPPSYESLLRRRWTTAAR